IIVLLGVLKSGGAYVPIDPEYPEDRIDFMLGDSGCRLLIDRYELECFMQESKLYSDVENGPSGKSCDLAYVIYTSGSSGQPKGVMVDHAAVAHSIQSQLPVFDIRAGDRSLQ